MFRCIGEYISLELFYFVNLTSSCSLILYILCPQEPLQHKVFTDSQKLLFICWACLHVYIHSVFLPPCFGVFLHAFSAAPLGPVRVSALQTKPATTAITGSDIANGGQVMHVNIRCIWVWNSSIKIQMIWTSAQLVWTFTQAAAENVQHTLKCLLLLLVLPTSMRMEHLSDQGT